MQKGYLKSYRLTQDSTLDFDLMSQGAGIVQLTLHNSGNVPVLLDDAAQQILHPQETFMVECPLGLINTSFSVKFLREKDKNNAQLVVRYVVPCL